MNSFLDSVCQPGLWFLADWTLRWILVIGIFGVWLAVFRPRRAATRYQVGLSVFLTGFLFSLLPRWGPSMEIPTMPFLPKMNSSAENRGPSDPNRLPIAEEVMPLNQKGRDLTSDLPITTSIPAELPITPTPQVPSQNEPLGTRRNVVLGLTIFWIIGVTGLLLRMGIGFVLLARLRQKASAVSDEATRLLEACRTDLGMHRQAILKIHPAARAPMVLGLYHPTILVPATWGELSDQEQRGCLLHELAHLARWDDWLKLIQECVRVFFFFNPFLHWLLARLEYERELLCDEAAIRLGIDPKDFVRILLKFADYSRRPVPEPIIGQFYSLPFGRIRTVKARITHLLEEKMECWISPVPVGRAIVLGIVVGGLALGLGSIQIHALESEGQPPSKEKAHPKDFPEKAEKNKKVVYRVEPFHVLKIEVEGLLPGDQIKDFYLVEPDGDLELGLRYGRVQLDGLTLEEASTVIRNQLMKKVRSPVVSVDLAGWVTKWQDDPSRKAPYRIRPRHVLRIRCSGTYPKEPIDGSFFVDLEGKINLGIKYEKLKVGGLTVEEASKILEDYLLKRKRLREPKVLITIGGWENDWLRVEEVNDAGAGPKDDKPPVKKVALRYNGKYFAEWREELKTELKPELRIEGFKAMSTFGVNGYGPEAARVIVEIMRGYDVGKYDEIDKAVIYEAHVALLKIGDSVIPILMDELRDGTPNDRRFAVWMLQDYGTKPTLPLLIAAVKDEDAFVRRTALGKLKSIGPQNIKNFIETLLDAIKDDDLQVRELALRALQSVGPDAKKAVPILITQLKEGPPDNLYLILATLGRIGPDAKEAIPRLTELLRTSDPDLSKAVTEALNRIKK